MHNLSNLRRVSRSLLLSGMPAILVIRIARAHKAALHSLVHSLDACGANGFYLVVVTRMRRL
jgi:hypothetical protein